MSKKHFTLSIPEEDILLVKIYAIRKQTTVSQVFHEWIRQYCTEEQSDAAAYSVPEEDPETE